MQINKDIVFFDGNCGLCARSVRYIRKRDKNKAFDYIPLQATEAEQHIGNNQPQDIDPDTVIFMQNGRFYYRSEAAIRIMMKLGGLNRLFSVFLIIPPGIRDYFYDLVARNRHKWFGTKDNCSIDIKE